MLFNQSTARGFTLRRVMFLAAISFAVFAAGMLFQHWRVRQGAREVSVEQFREGTFNQGKYRFINPLLGCVIDSKKDLQEFLPLKNKLQDFISNKIYNHELTTASIYFDTRDGKWLGINTNEKYFPASLMKVPTMIAFYKEAESHPELLNKKITYNGDFDLNQLEYFTPQKVLQSHHSYTINDLIERMIIYSDNNTLPLLVSMINKKELDEVYTDLGITIPQDEEASLADFMTVKSFAHFFRVLYNASYLNREMSEKALSLLIPPDFSLGIEGGVPNTIPVAQKFGERNFNDKNDGTASVKELHDCGIIYYPDHPYLLCIMTKGADFQKLSSIIKGISQLVYEHVDGQFKE